MKKKRIAVVGSLNYDIILKQKRLPKIGETYTADSISFCNGGKGANQAVQCSKLGADTVMIGCVGYDNFGNEVIRGLKKYDVYTDYTIEVSAAKEDLTTYTTILNSYEKRANGNLLALNIDLNNIKAKNFVCTIPSSKHLIAEL